jgi:hypothetical protein
MNPAAFVMAAMLLQPPVDAQSASPRSGLIRTALPTVFVLDDRGVETRGNLLTLDDTSVVLLVGDEERRFDIRNVTRVSKRGDSLKNGALSGLVIGIGMGVLGSMMSDCGSSSSCPTDRVVLGVISTALYTAIGTAVDAAVQGRTTLYKRPNAPNNSARGASFALRFSW